MRTDLHTKYRPKKLDHVLGQDHIVKSLKDVLEKESCHAFIFTGPSGVGKTTFARIIARHVKCSSVNLIEVDAATHTGIDAMRDIISSLNFAPLGDSRARVVIVDEAHALSKAAWQSLLKCIEEPPNGTIWVLCTTEASKIPDTIKTRCVVYDLKPVKKDDLFDYISEVAAAEKIELDKDCLYLIAEKAEGSVRRALTFLAQCAGASDMATCLSILKSAGEASAETIELCRLLMKGANWQSLMALVSKLEDPPESIRRTVLGYYTKVALGAKTGEAAAHALTVIEAFSEPYFVDTTTAPLLLSIGKVLFQVQ